MLWPFGRSMGSVVFMSQWAVFGGERKMEERDLSNCKSMRVFLFFSFSSFSLTIYRDAHISRFSRRI